MTIYLVPVEKEYTSGTVYGRLPTEAGSEEEAVEVVKGAMIFKERNGKADCLQTIDPRIVWFTEAEPGDYFVDFSFGVSEDDPVEEADKPYQPEQVLLNADDIRVENRVK